MRPIADGPTPFAIAVPYYGHRQADVRCMATHITADYTVGVRIWQQL